MTPPPCQTGQSCPKIEEAKLVIFIEFSKQLKEACDPILKEIREGGKDLAIHSERMRTGAARFEAIEKNALAMNERVDGLESWRDNQAGEQKATQEEAKKSGKKWALGVGIFSLILQALGWLWNSKGGG